MVHKSASPSIRPAVTSLLSFFTPLIQTTFDFFPLIFMSYALMHPLILSTIVACPAHYLPSDTPHLHTENQPDCCCCSLPTLMTIASGGSPIFPLVVHQPGSPSIGPVVPSLRWGLSTNKGVTMGCVCGCS